MTSERDPAHLVASYLQEIRRYLPTEIANDVIPEIEEHLWDRAAEYGEERITWESMRQAIIKMGPPKRMIQAYLELDEGVSLRSKEKISHMVDKRAEQTVWSQERRPMLISPELLPVFKLWTITAVVISVLVFGSNIIISSLGKPPGRIMGIFIQQLLFGSVIVSSIVGVMLITFIFLTQVGYEPSGRMYEFHLKKPVEYVIIAGCTVLGVVIAFLELILFISRFDIPIFYLIASMGAIGFLGVAGTSILKLLNEENLDLRIRLTYVTLALEILILPMAILLFMNPGIIPLIIPVGRPFLHFTIARLSSGLFGIARILILGIMILSFVVSV
ncbi:MAG: hypothetical protein ACFFC7_22090, partial [Candidatus Hermodarchaeota archaeon]